MTKLSVYTGLEVGLGSPNADFPMPWFHNRQDVEYSPICVEQPRIIDPRFRPV